MNKILFIDTETTGLFPDVNGVHQAAGILLVNGQVVDEFNLKFDTLPTEIVEDEALAVSGLTLADIRARKVSSWDAYKDFDKRITKHVNKFDKGDKAIIAGYNCNFDAQFLCEWYRKHGNKYFFGLFHGGAYLDGLNLALLAELKAGKRLFFPDRKLGTVAKSLGIELEGAHDALADIRATRQVIKTLWMEIIK